jgi:hypothetical protein
MIRTKIGQVLAAGDARAGAGRGLRAAFLSVAVTTLLSALSYRTQSWSISMPFCGLY